MSRSAPAKRTDEGDAQRSDGVQVIRRTAQILDALREHPEGLSLSQLATRTELARSTVHRLVSALTEEHFLMSATPNGRVRLGPAISALGHAAEANIVLDLHPELATLARELNETVDLAVLEHDHVRFIDQISAMHRLRAVSAVGALFPAYATANGKALLAELDDAAVIRMLPEELKPFTPHTITSRAALLEELDQIRQDKIAVDHQEHTVGICAAGVAVDDGRGRKVAITVPMPSQRFAQHEKKMRDALLQTRRRIGRATRKSS